MKSTFLQKLLRIAVAVSLMGITAGYLRPLASLAAGMLPEELNDPTDLSPTSTGVLISEFYPDPASGKEYVEIYNGSDEEILLDGLSVYDVSSPALNACVNFGKLLALGGTIGPNEYLAIELDSARLNNNGDRLQLRSAAGTVMDEIMYGVCGTVPAEKGLTLGRLFFQGEPIVPIELANPLEVLKLSPTPNFLNYLLGVVDIEISGNLKLGETIMVAVILDDSVARQKVELSSIQWSKNGEFFAEASMETELTLDQAGSYVIGIKIGDNFGNAGVFESAFEVEDLPTEPIDYSGLKINEVFPSPGDGVSEWVEILNTANADIELGGVSLDDITGGGSLPYIFASGTIIHANEFLVVTKAESGIAFNNSGDDVVMAAPTGAAIDRITYPSVGKNLAFVLYSGDWVISNQPTPGEENLPNFEEPPEVLEIISIKTAKGKLGETVRILGKITAGTNEVAKDVAYIQDATAGIRVKLTGVDAKLVRGKTYELIGKIGESWGETVVDVEKVDSSSESISISTKKLSPNKISISSLSSLVQVNGVVTKVSGGSIWIGETVDSIDTIKVFISSSLDWDWPDWIKKGENIKATGIVSQWGLTAAGDPNLRILPRDNKDLKQLDDTGKVLGADHLVLPETGGYSGYPGLIGLVAGLGAKGYQLIKKRAFKLV